MDRQKNIWSADVTLECSSPKIYQHLTSGRHKNEASRILIQTPWNWPATSSATNFGLRTPATDNMRYLYISLSNTKCHTSWDGTTLIPTGWFLSDGVQVSIPTSPLICEAPANSLQQSADLKKAHPPGTMAPAMLKGLVGKVCCSESLTISHRATEGPSELEASISTIFSGHPYEFVVYDVFSLI